MRRILERPQIAVAIVLCMLATARARPHLQGPAASEQDRIRDLEHEITRLRAENAGFRALLKERERCAKKKGGKGK